MNPQQPDNWRYTPLQIAVNGGGQTIAWYVCVSGGAHAQPLWAPASLGALLFLHGRLHPRSIWPTTLRLLAAGMLFGLLFDTLLIQTGVYIPKRTLIPAPLPPLWLLILWGNFAMCLHVAFRVLITKPVLAAAVGAIFGPSAYLGAAGLGALTLSAPQARSLIVLSFAWAFAVWALSRLAGFIEKKGGTPPGPFTVNPLKK